MKKIWAKTNTTIDPKVEAYTAGTDHVFDHVLLPFDIKASKVHASGLVKIGILTEAEYDTLLSALDALLAEHEEGRLAITPTDEDCHTVIENHLIARVGDVGKKIHTGRSRNDQVLVAMRLYMLSALTDTARLLGECAATGKHFADTYQNVPLPGYTHTQQAMLSSVGHYALALTESLLDDIDIVLTTHTLINKNPLGSAAGFGVSLPLDRIYTTTELGFKNLQVNSLYCQNARGKFESMTLESLAQIMLTLGRFASDVLWFTSQECNFFTIDNSLTTGSSIMPQKQNVDAAEVLRGNVSVVIGNQHIVKDVSKNLISGYHRDLQLIKKPVMESVDIVKSSIEVAILLLRGIHPHSEEIMAKITPGMFQADIANKMVTETGVPFRDAYQKAATETVATDADFLAENIASKVSLGAPGNLDFASYESRLTVCQEKIDALQ